MNKQIIVLGAFALVSLSPVARAAEESVTCVVSRDGGQPNVTVVQKIEPNVWVEGAPSQLVLVGKRHVHISSNAGHIFVSVLEAEQARTGPAVFNAEYRNLEGSKEEFGFTGEVRLNNSANAADRQASFYCYKN